MKCLKSIEEIIRHLKAKRPIIWVDTFEEERFIEDLIDMIMNAQDPDWLQENPEYAFLGNFNLADWSQSRGLREFIKEDMVFGNPIEQTQANPARVIQRIESEQNNMVGGSFIYLMKDMHHFLSNSANGICRTFRDVKEYRSKNYVPVIFVSPIIDIPVEMEKIVTVVNYDLPDKEDIEELVLNAVANIEQMNEKGKNYPVPGKEEINSLITSCMGLTRNEIMSVFRHSLINYEKLSPSAIVDEKMQLIKKSGVLDFQIPKAGFDDIGGNHNFKKWIDEVHSTFEEEALEYGVEFPRGYMAFGVPGSSKTFAAEAIANKFEVPFIKFNVSKIFDRLVGSSERNAERAFKVAKACAPCVLLIDEIEKVMGGTSSSNQSDSGTTNRVFQKLLELLHENNQVFVVMTANNITELPSELKRAGRIDALWYFSLPTFEERKEIFRIHLNRAGKKITQKVINTGAKSAENYTGAEIEEVCKVALRKSYFRYKKDKKEPTITEKDVNEAIKEVIPLYDSCKEAIQQMEKLVIGRARMASEGVFEERQNINDRKLEKDFLNLHT